MGYRTILVVEDDPDISSSLQEFFEGEGYPVLMANHGQAALDLIKKHSDVKLGMILLDVMMPVMDGPTFLLELEKKHPDLYAQIPTFVITAGGDTHRLACKSMGALKKPFDLDELSKLAARYCGLLP